MAEADPVSIHRGEDDIRIGDVLETAHILRSRLLDSFASLETETFALAKFLQVKAETSAPLGQRIGALRAVVVEDKKRLARLHDLLDELAHLSGIRAHIVHSSIRPVCDLIDRNILLQFRLVPSDKGLCLTMPLEDVKLLPRKVSSLVNQLKQFRTPPPQPAAKPKPAAIVEKP